MRTLKSILSPQDDIKNDITLNVDPNEWFKKAIKNKEINNAGQENVVQLRKSRITGQVIGTEYIGTLYVFTDKIIKSATFAVIVKEYKTGGYGFGIWFKPYGKVYLAPLDVNNTSYMINLYHDHKDECWKNIKSMKDAEELVKKLLFKSYQVLNDDFHHWMTMLCRIDNIHGYKFMDINNILNEKI